MGKFNKDDVDPDFAHIRHQINKGGIWGLLMSFVRRDNNLLIKIKKGDLEDLDVYER